MLDSLILRASARYVLWACVALSVFVLLRGHNKPGGGFIGGLIAVSALAIFGIANGISAVRRALWFHPMAISAFGLFIACIAGLLSAVFAVPFMTGLWIYPVILRVEIPLSSVMLFDTGVYLVVVGSITSIALALEAGDDA